MSWRYRARKRIAGAAGSLAFRLMMSFSKKMNQKRIERWGDILAALAYRGSKRYRNMTARNLTMAFGNEYSAEKIDEMVKEVFRHFCRGALEFFYLASADKSVVNDMIDLSDVHHLDDALKAGNGAILVTAHFGNWELLARKMCLLGYPVTVIARDSDDPSMTGIANKVREGAGYKVLGRDKSVRGAIECLKRNEILGILPDQNVSKGGIFVDFFGYPASTATGPAAFALKTGAAVIPVFAARAKDGKYHAKFMPPIQHPSTGDKVKDEAVLTAAIMKAIENAIREYPTQWLWLHDRWKKARELGKLNG